MSRAITAIYPSETTALQVSEALARLGVPGGDITMIPDPTGGSAEPATDRTAPLARIDALGLPEEDTRTYREAVRNGDWVVSVDVGDTTPVERIREVMRDPTAPRDLDALDREYPDAGHIPFRHEDRPADPHDRSLREDEPGHRSDLPGGGLPPRGPGL